MPTVSASSLFTLQMFTDAGALMASGRLYTFAPGTTTKKVAYTEPTGTTAHTYTTGGDGIDYIALNARGELPAPLFLQSGGYDITLKDSSGNTEWTRRAYGINDGASTLDTAVRSDLAATSSTSLGDALVGVKRTVTGAIATTQHAINERETLCVFDMMTAAQVADVIAGTRAENVTTAVQAAIDAASASADKETALRFPPGDYAVNVLDFSECRQVHIICEGAVFITGVSASETKIIKFEGIEADAVTGLQMSGTMAVQAAGGTSYAYGIYARWLTNSVINMSVSGAFSTACADFDVCFDNEFQWLYCSNTTSGKHMIKCGSDNVNANRWRVRCAGSGSANTQIGMELNGNANAIIGDFSACGEGLKLTAARGSIITAYCEACLTSVTASGVNRGNTFVGGYYDVLDGSTGLNFSGGTMQGLNLLGMRIRGETGTTVGINLGTSSYSVNLLGTDFEAIDTEVSGTLRGSTGGVNGQLMGATRHYSNGVFQTLGGSAQTIVLQTVAGAGTVSIDASAGDEQYLTVSTGSGFTIGAPTNATTGQLLVINIRNSSGGALGTVTWNATFKMAAWTSPGNANSRSIVFRYDGSNWVERFRTPADVPN